MIPTAAETGRWMWVAAIAISCGLLGLALSLVIDTSRARMTKPHAHAQDDTLASGPHSQHAAPNSPSPAQIATLAADAPQRAAATASPAITPAPPGTTIEGSIDDADGWLQVDTLCLQVRAEHPTWLETSSTHSQHVAQIMPDGSFQLRGVSPSLRYTVAVYGFRIDEPSLPRRLGTPRTLPGGSVGVTFPLQMTADIRVRLATPGADEEPPPDFIEAVSEAAVDRGKPSDARRQLGTAAPGLTKAGIVHLRDVRIAGPGATTWVTVLASPTSFNPAILPLKLRALEVHDLGTVQLEAAARISVQVHDESGTPIAGATVTQHAAELGGDLSKGLGAVDGSPASTKTNTRGIGHLRGQNGVACSIRVCCPGFQDSSERTVRFPPAGVHPTTIRLLRAPQARVRVLGPNRRPLSRLEVYAKPLAHAAAAIARTHRERTDQDGLVTFSQLLPGEYEFGLSASEVLPAAAALRTSSATATAQAVVGEPLELELHTADIASVQGEVRGHNAAAPFAKIRLRHLTSRLGGPLLPPTDQTANRDGFFRFDNLLVGTYSARITLGEGQPTRRVQVPIQLLPGVNRRDLEIHGVAIRGTVTDAAHQPIAGAVVTASSSRNGIHTTGVSGPAGDFEIHGLHPEIAITLEARAQGYGRCVREGVIPGHAAAGGVTMRLESGGTVVVSLRSATPPAESTTKNGNRALPRFAFRSLELSPRGDPASRQTIERTLKARRDSTTTDSETVRSERFDNIPVGAWTLTYRSVTMRALVTQSLEVRAGETTQVTLSN